MIQVNFKMVRNGFKLVDVTYGNYETFVDAAKSISKDVQELEKAEVGYFSHFNTKMNDANTDYRFGWTCEWYCEEEIAEFGFFEIGGVGKTFKENYVRWEIVVKTSTEMADKEKALKMP